MRFLVDENLPPAVVNLLSSRDHDVVSVGSVYQGVSDEKLWDLAAFEDRILVTQDLDFPFDRLPRPPGLLLIRLPHWFLSPQIAMVVEDFVDNYNISQITGGIAVVSPGRVRFRGWQA